MSKTKEWNVRVVVYHTIYGIEAETKEEAERIATDDEIWDDHIVACDIEAEEVTP